MSGRAKGASVIAGTLDRNERQQREPIAIVGIGCRYPGIQGVESFWDVLVNSRETIGEYPGGRFDYIDKVYAVDGPLSGRIATRRGGFLREIDRFDAEFFEISPREAALLDPQQRLLLEVAWEAIDDAGLRQDQVAGSGTGVFVGLWTSDYEAAINETSDGGDFYATIGTGRYSASGRVAYVLDARGPNLTLDTACSSSLLAIHLACQSVWAGECRMALAGGVNIILRPEITLAYSAAQMLSPDGRSKFADVTANGYVRSEGAGIVVLKTLSQALADGDPVYAVVRGSAVNNDGRSSGSLVAPGRGGQEAAIRAAIHRAGVTPEEVDYVEAHGPGTSKGDPIELTTIGEVLGTASRTHPCLVGSVKTNIGHTEAAAGVAGVIKVALALQHRIIPASLHCQEPTPHVDWNKYAIAIATQQTAWPRSAHAPCGCVSSFGITGTNVDTILEAAPEQAAPQKPVATDRPFVFTLSGHTPTALQAVVRSWRDRLDRDAAWPASFVDLAHTASIRRTPLDTRMTVVADCRDTLRDRLAAWANGEEGAGIVTGLRVPHTPSKTVFVYSGQGGQWTGMGRGLYAHEPVFREALERCDAAVRRHADWSVVDMVLRDENNVRMAEHDVVQPVLFALAFALTELWRSLGVEPAAVVGHSLGEVAAAAVAGALSLDDAAAVACHRSRAMKRVVGRGMMALVELPVDDVRQWIAKAGNLWIGALNGASSTVVSGDIDAVETLLRTFEANEIFCRRVRTDVASHSGHMDEARGDLEIALRTIKPRQGSIPMYSTTTGEIEDGSRLDAEYWGKNLRQPVLFYPAMQQLLNDGFDTFVEVNAHPVLTHTVLDSIQRAERDAVVTVSMRRDADEQTGLLDALGTLHVAGYRVDWSRVNPRGSHMRLPAYPWQRERYWFEPPTDVTSRRHLLGEATEARRETERAKSTTRVDPAACLYELEWIDVAQTATAASPAASTTRDWVVLSNERRGDVLAESLTALGRTCMIVRPGGGFKQIDAQTFEVDPTSVDDMQRLFRDHVVPGSGVIHAWSLTECETLPDINGILEAQVRGSLSATALVRAVATLALAQPPRVWLVTHGTQTVLQEPTTTPWDASLMGFGRVAAVEHPEMPCTNLDLSAVPTDSELQYAAGLITRDVAEQQIAVRGNRQFNARYRRAGRVAETRAAAGIRPDATYVITGGLGGIGLLAARWLVDRGARYLVLTGRRGPSDEAAQVIVTLEAAGAQVKIVAADIADPAHVTRLIETVDSDMPPIAGVLHLAAVVEYTLIRDATTDSFQRVFGPKMLGAWNLYRALQQRSLDFYVLFSSVGCVIPQPRSASYAAANAFLDGVARYGAGRGVPITSVQWGPWADTGLMGEGQIRGALRMYEAQGILPMSPALGFRMLERALASPAPVLFGASVQWDVFAAVCSADAEASEFLHLAVEADAGSRSAGSKVADGTADGMADTPAPDLRATFAGLASGRPRLGAIEVYLREQLARVLKTAPERLDLQKPMGNMGVDSLLALEFVRQLTRTLGIKVPATVVFNYPTIKKLAVLLESRMGFAEEPRGDTRLATPTAAPPSPQSPVAESTVDDMSDLDAIRALSGQGS